MMRTIKVYTVSGLCALLLTTNTVLADKPTGVIKLGLDLATATADRKSVTEGIKKVGQDEFSDWLWDSIGGYERLVTSSSEASIPGARKKLKSIVELVQNIEKFAIAMTEGKYDDALFAAIDQAVSVANHPLVSATWAACKLTYESHKMVQASQAAVDIERIYNIVHADRRLMGQGGSKDSPPQLAMTSEQVDYFFQKYVVTDASARAAFRSYVETEIGETWPEQSWGEWTRSWLSIGSGVDTEAAAEIERLSGEWRNKARTWIMRLMKDVNEQAKKQWAETRVRQEMARFKNFVNRVGHFYNDDFEQMVREYESMRRHENALPQYREMLEKSKKLRNETQEKISTRAYLRERNGIREIRGVISAWSRDTYSAGTGARIGGDRELSDELMKETRAWRELRDSFAEKIEEEVEDIIEDQTEEAINAVNIFSTVRSSEASKAADIYYKEVFERIIVPFELSGRQFEIEAEGVPRQRVSAETNMVISSMLDILNSGQFGLAEDLLEKWDREVMSEFGAHYTQMRSQVWALRAKEPSRLVSAREAYESKNNAVRPRINALYDRKRQTSDWDQRMSIRWQISELWREVRPFWDTYRAEAAGWTRAKEVALKNVNDLNALDSTAILRARTNMRELYSAFIDLRNARKQQLELYEAPINRFNGFYNREFRFLMGSSEVVDKELQQLKDDTHTYVTPIRQDPAPFQTLPGALRAYANRIERRNRPLDLQYRNLERVENLFNDIMSSWKALPRLQQNEIDQIRVLVDPSFDPVKAFEGMKVKEQEVRRELKKMRANIMQYEKLADTDGSNRMKDSQWLREKAQRIDAFINDMGTAGHTSWRPQIGFGINVEIDRNTSMALLDEPYKRYATSEELRERARPVREAWQRSGLGGFVSKYAPDYHRSLMDILNMGEIEPAEGPNFIMSTGEVVYADDIKKAKAMMDGLSPEQDDIEDVFRRIAILLPRVLNLRTSVEQKNMEVVAARYGLTVEEYERRMRIQPETFTVRDGARNFGPGSEYDIGRSFEQAVEDLEDITEKRAQFLRDEQARKRQEQIEAEQKRRQQEEEARSRQMAMESLPRGLADLYGFYVHDVRINTYPLDNARGEIIFTRDEVPQGRFDISGRINKLERVEKMLLSVDGGRTWQEMAARENFSYSFTPIPGIVYKLVMRIQLESGDDFSFDMLPNSDGVVYRDISFTQLIIESIKAIADSYQNSDMTAFSDYISRDFMGQRVFLEEGVRFDFDMFTSIRLVIYINRIERSGDLHIVETSWNKTQTPRATGLEQRTSGRTTFILVYEDGKMKIKNLRGNLIYATLSPEIAQSSGLGSDTIDAIRSARNERVPVQPGAGETQDAGGVGILTVFQASVKINQGYDLSAHRITGWEAGDIVHDLDDTFEINPPASMEPTNIGFQDINNVTNVVGSGPVSFNTGQRFIFRTRNGNYGKMEIISVEGSEEGCWFGEEEEEEDDPRTVTFRYAVQTDGSSNVRTR